jgi:DNA polymerase
MDRREAMLRELNLYPQWVRRDQPALKAPQGLALHSQSTKPQAASRWFSHPEGVGNPLSAEADVGLTLPIAAEVEAIIPTAVAIAAPLESTVNVQPSVPSSQIDGLNWPELKQQVRDCTACKLRAGCTQTVFGVGDENADWLFVGEGPGEDEDAQGEPFVGEAGKLLDNMLAAIKLKRGKNVYIANIVKCHPPDNRNPAAAEIAQCLPYLHRQIALIQPKLIVALGKVASNALLIKPLANRLGESTALAESLVMGKEATLASLRGTLHDYHGIPLIVTYHPAYLLRSPTEKAKAWQDLCLATDTMQKL